MANKDILIHLKTAFDGAGINATRDQVTKVASDISRSMGGAQKKMMNGWADVWASFKIASTAIKAAWSGVRSALSASFKFERQTMQFKTLIGNIDEARAHMAELKALGDTPPFGVDEFASASRAMMVMTDGVLGYKESLELVGDAAAATGVPIEDMGRAVSRLYSFIRDGQPLSRAVAELRNMGIITPEVAQKLQDMQKAGATNIEIWNEVTGSLAKYKGAMAETEKTGDGLIGAIKSRWDNIVRQFGDAFADAARGGMTDVLDKMKELESSNTIKDWADLSVTAINKVAGAFSVVAKWINAVRENLKREDEFNEMMGEIKKSGGVSSEVISTETMPDGSVREVIKNPDGSISYSYTNEVSGAKSVTPGAHKPSITDDMAAHQVEIDRKNAEKKEKEEKKLADKKEKEEQSAFDKALTRETEIVRRVHAERMKLLNEEIRRRDVAKDRFEKEFSMYRDESLRDETMNEESDRAAELARLKKDVSRYNLEGSVSSLANILRTQGEDAFNEEILKRRNGRGLVSFGFQNRDIEQIVRTAATREAKTTSEVELARIEENTRDLGEKLDELLAMKGGE